MFLKSIYIGKVFGHSRYNVFNSKWHMGFLTAGSVGTGLCGAEERVDGAVAQTGHNEPLYSPSPSASLCSHLSSFIDLILKTR